MEKRIIVYGVLKQFTLIDEQHYCLILIEDGTKQEWEVIVPKWNVYEDLMEDDHYYASGVAVLGGIVADEVDRWGRYCDVCGKWHTEGYFVGEHEYACSERCAIDLYHGDADAFYADLALLDDPETADDAPTYWTEWE